MALGLLWLKRPAPSRNSPRDPRHSKKDEKGQEHGGRDGPGAFVVEKPHAYSEQPKRSKAIKEGREMPGAGTGGVMALGLLW